MHSEEWGNCSSVDEFRAPFSVQHQRSAQVSTEDTSIHAAACRWRLGSQKNGKRKGSAWGATGREVLLLWCSWVQGGGDIIKKTVWSPCGNCFCYSRNTWSKVQVTEPYRLRITVSSTDKMVGCEATSRGEHHTHTSWEKGCLKQP